MRVFFLCVVSLFIIQSADVLSQDSQIPSLEVTSTGWSEEYGRLLEVYDENCDSDIIEEYIQFACDDLKAVLNAESESRIALLQHTIEVFQRQGFASTVVLFLVVFVVLSGILLAAYQLWIAAKNGGPQSNSELEASASKVRITSSSVGLVVLTLSLLFLYLYVMEIFRISVIQVG